jgi:hypothetical protein
MPFGKINPLEALRTLTGMNTGTNVRNLDARGLDIAQGYGDYEPSEVELMDAQNELGGSVSRESLRSGAMSHIKRKLAEGQTAQNYKMQVEGAQHQRELGKQRLANEGSSNVARIQTEGKAAQAEMQANAKQAALDAMLEQFGGTGRGFNVSGVGGVSPERAAGPTTRQLPTDQMNKTLRESRGAYRGSHPIDAVLDSVPGLSALSGTNRRRTEYEQSLQSILHRSGSLQDLNDAMAGLAQYPGSLQDKIAAAQQDDSFEFDLSGLDPYEQEYLKLKLEQ